MRRMLLWLAIGMLGAVAPAAADTISVWNCSGGSISFKLYNEGDIFCAIAKYSVTLANCSLTTTLQCDGKCKVDTLGLGSCLGYTKLNGSWTVMKSMTYNANYTGVTTTYTDGNGKYWITSAGAACGC
jgi:hypothetical protein